MTKLHRPEPEQDGGVPLSGGTQKGKFKPVSSRVSFPKMEEEIIAFWKAKDIFRRSVDQRRGQPQFTLFEGPPTANGNPGIHHVLSRVFKDVFPRYKAMKGYYVPRKGGWDTHGLPVELEVEKELGIKSKPDIEAFGIEEFNKRCRESVFRYVKEWERMTDRVAYWVDLENAYVTYDNKYIESGWWIIKTLWEAGLVYQGRRVTPHCARCGTTLSSHEVALGYKDETPDPSVYVKFHIASHSVPSKLKAHIHDKTFLLAWTTTPWTLPGNSGLSVAADKTYVVEELESGERLILAQALLGKALKGEHRTIAEFQGSDLQSLRYHPLYDPVERGVEVRRFSHPGSPVVERVDTPPKGITYPVIAADFVSMEDGTGIVHTAPPFGEDDYSAGVANGLYFVQPVTLAGEFVQGYPWSGKFVKKADQQIMADLDSRGLLLRKETIRHTYPFCWRCDTPLLYYAKSSWYLKTTAVKERLIAGNEAINWRPEHVKEGRFGEWLRNNVDWAVSRERYWGTPWPVWECAACGKQECIGSVAELRAKPGVRGLVEHLDLHRPYVDRVTWQCASCTGEMRRSTDVIDCWFDSGAMPIAQWHYPFENKALIEGGPWYPADYICEAVDQTRGWFYSLHAIATMLEMATEKTVVSPSYKNVICLGHILDGKGEKMSKSRGNVVKPWDIIDVHGADALRWYLYTASPPGNSRRFSADLVAEAIRSFLLTLWNTYSFFITYANIDGFDPTKAKPAPQAELDRWVLSRLHSLAGEVTAAMEEYDPTTAARKIDRFVDDLSNWYVRRSRRRFWKSESDADKSAAYATLHECLVTVAKLVAPFTPFIAEDMYQNLVRTYDRSGPESVHLADYPTAEKAKIDAEVQRATDTVITVVSLGRAARSKAKLKVRQPLARIVIATPAQERAALTRLADHVREELNVKEVAFAESEAALVTHQVKGNPAALGPKFGKEMGKVMTAISKADAKAVTPKVRAGLDIEIGGYALEPGDVHIVAEDKAGFATASDGPLTVAVSTEITKELALEGTAREIVHRIQTMRRSANFAIEDRIATYYTASGDVAAAFKAHAEYIKQETLSATLQEGTVPAGAFTEAGKLDGAEVTIGVVKLP
jgi:isoleucyl-tRNA synthetase